LFKSYTELQKLTCQTKCQGFRDPVNPLELTSVITSSAYA